MTSLFRIIKNWVIHMQSVALSFSQLLIFVGSFLAALSQTSNNSTTSSDRPDAATFLGLHSIEIVARITLLSVHLHMRQFLVSAAHRQSLLEIHRFLRPALLKEKVRNICPAVPDQLHVQLYIDRFIYVRDYKRR